jgi:hypothetical protein
VDVRETCGLFIELWGLVIEFWCGRGFVIKLWCNRGWGLCGLVIEFWCGTGTSASAPSAIWVLFCPVGPFVVVDIEHGSFVLSSVMVLGESKPNFMSR